MKDYPITSALSGTNRLLIEAKLKPIQGDRFQPTGFADLGAGVYERPDGKRMLLVESAQSVANRLEYTCLEDGTPRLRSEFAGLPYVVVNLQGPGPDLAATSSLFEAHRINSPYIIANPAFKAKFQELTKYSKGQPLNWPQIARGVFRLDPCSLLHGLFMANFEDGRIKLPRAVSGFIEAEDIREVYSGGVKNNPLDPSGKIRAKGYDKDVYSNVPYHRTEYVASKITAYFNLDVALLRGYALTEPGVELLLALALFKIRHFLHLGLRLRTACDLTIDGEPRPIQPADFVIPSEGDAKKQVITCIQACKTAKLFDEKPVTELLTEVVIKSKDKHPADEGAEEESDASMVRNPTI